MVSQITCPTVETEVQNSKQQNSAYALFAGGFVEYAHENNTLKNASAEDHGPARGNSSIAQL
jgi:hypothetical protein